MRGGGAITVMPARHRRPSWTGQAGRLRKTAPLGARRGLRPIVCRRRQPASQLPYTPHRPGSTDASVLRHAFTRSRAELHWRSSARVAFVRTPATRACARQTKENRLAAMCDRSSTGRWLLAISSKTSAIYMTRTRAIKAGLSGL